MNNNLKPKRTTHDEQSGLVPATCSASAWCDSRVEEVIGTLWLIAAFVALDAGCPKWIFVTLFVKAGLDTMTAIGFAIKDCITKESKRPNDES
jgi:hypothetical protein